MRPGHCQSSAAHHVFSRSSAFLEPSSLLLRGYFPWIPAHLSSILPAEGCCPHSQTTCITHSALPAVESKWDNFMQQETSQCRLWAWRGRPWTWDLKVQPCEGRGRWREHSGMYWGQIDVSALIVPGKSLHLHWWCFHPYLVCVFPQHLLPPDPSRQTFGSCLKCVHRAFPKGFEMIPQV